MTSFASTANLCPAPFFSTNMFPDDQGYVPGRMCQTLGPGVTCCIPCPLTDWIYPDSFKTLTSAASWISAISLICSVFLLVSWAVLPVEKTNRHYLSICLTFSVLLMNLGFVIPLAAKPNQCANAITPNGMSSSPVCGASGTLLLFGGWGGVMWAFLRSLSLHLQICWQVLVGRNFMWFAQVAGWGVPVLDVVLALVFTGVSFRFGATCHINHPNSLADFWIPLLIFACATVIITFATFGYCIKVYLASLADNAASTEGSSVPTYTHSIHTVTPRQAYRRVRRVIALQWRGIAIVLIIIADVIFFSIVFVFQDNIIEQVSKNPQLAESWIICLNEHPDDKNQCLNKVGKFVVNEATVMAVLLLLSLNGVWLLLLLGRMSMFKGWVELLMSLPSKRKNEFVSVDARLDVKNDPRSYEMLSKGQNSVVTPPDTVRSPDAGRRTPDYFRQAAQYHSPTRSISSPMPHQVSAWDPEATYASPKDTSVETHVRSRGHEDLNPLGMNRV